MFGYSPFLVRLEIAPPAVFGYDGKPPLLVSVPLVLMGRVLTPYLGPPRYVDDLLVPNPSSYMFMPG